MKKMLFLMLLTALLFTGCNIQTSSTIDIPTAKKIALNAYSDYEIVSITMNDYGFTPSYIIFLSNGKFLYIIQVTQQSGVITQVRHELLNTSSL